MTWFVSNEEQSKAISEIEQTKSDRAAAIVGVAFVEEDLRNAIEARLVADKSLVEKMFRPSGPLGGFEAKADLGFLLGIYTKKIHADILLLAKIRNRFAHWRGPVQFDSREIRECCKSLTMIDEAEYPKLPGDGLPNDLRSPPRLAEKHTPKDRFVLTIKLLIIVFWAASHHLVLTDGKTRVWKEQEPPKS